MTAVTGGLVKFAPSALALTTDDYTYAGCSPYIDSGYLPDEDCAYNCYGACSSEFSKCYFDVPDTHPYSYAEIACSQYCEPARVVVKCRNSGAPDSFYCGQFCGG